MICPKCGTPNRSSAKFCDECGYELPSVAPIAREIFDEEEEQTCTPKSAPTADLSGVDEEAYPTLKEPALESQVPEIVKAPSLEASPTQAISDPEIDVQATEILPDVDAQKTEVISPVDADVTSVMTTVAGAQSPDYSHEIQSTAVMGEVDVMNNGKTAVMNPVNAPGDSQKNYSSSATDKKKNANPSVKRNILIALATVVVIAAALGITYMLQLWGGKIVPDVMGVSQEEAIAEVHAAGFVVSTEEIASDEVAGIVIGMEPGANTRAGEGTEVKLQISVRRVIPSIVGMNIDEVKALMEKNGFTNVEYVTEKSDETKDSVIKVLPEEGTRCKANAKITITTAIPYTVPDVEGMSQDEAISALEEAGYNAVVETQINENVAEGSAISTSPAKDSELKSGSNVTLYVAKHRSTELEALTRDFFSGSEYFTISGTPYQLVELVGVQWTSGGNVAYTITARKIDLASLLLGNQNEAETIQGSIAWDDNDNISTTDPSISQGINIVG